MSGQNVQMLFHAVFRLAVALLMLPLMGMIFLAGASGTMPQNSSPSV
jgi:hypothetical protein